MGWRAEFEAEKFLDSQPLHLQPLVTDCIVECDGGSSSEVRRLFEQRLPQFMQKDSN